MTRLKVTVFPKAGVLDPQGKAIERALAGLDFAGVGEVRVWCDVTKLSLSLSECKSRSSVGCQSFNHHNQ